MGRIQKIQKFNPLGCPGAHRFAAAALILALLLNGCATYRRVRIDKSKAVLNTASIEVAESQLLDVRIQVFDPGELPESENAARGISRIIRQAESKYMPVQLKNTMQHSGHWGAVRVVPSASSGDEVLVRGTILESNGEVLKLRIRAYDSRGIEWFDKKFKGAVSEQMHAEASKQGTDVFQNVYYRIANELAEYYKTLTPEHIRAIRRTAEMRFAAELVPDAFSGYVQQGKNDQYTIDRLPSENDEMLARVRRVRERDYMLIDTLDAHYETMNHDMQMIYANWRKSRLMEMNLIRKVDDARNKKLAAGTLLILAGIALGVIAGNGGDYSSAASAGIGAAVGVGASILIAATQAGEETAINKAALEELGVSFTAEVEPTVLEVEGKTIELTGSAEEKYRQWQVVLGKLYQVETGSDQMLSPAPDPEKPAPVSNNPD